MDVDSDDGLLRWVIRVRQRAARHDHALTALALVGVAAGITTAVLFRAHLPGVRHAGYVGIALMNLVGSGAIVLPTPTLLAVYIGGSYLNPLVVAIVAGITGTLGETTGYLLGFSGRRIAERHGQYEAVRRWMQQRGGLALFVMAALPNPFFDIAGAAAGSLRFPLPRFFLFVALGKLLKNGGIAYAGAWSLPVVERLFRSLF